MEQIRLGLIGDNIAASRAPDLHHAAARICGIDVKYERLVPRDLGLTFDDVVERAKQDGFRGLNITYPYKEHVLGLVTIEQFSQRVIKNYCALVNNNHPLTQLGYIFHIVAGE